MDITRRQPSHCSITTDTLAAFVFQDAVQREAFCLDLLEVVAANLPIEIILTFHAAVCCRTLLTCL